MNNKEKKDFLSLICISLCGLLRVSGGRWKGARDLSSDVLIFAIPLLISHTTSTTITSTSTSTISSSLLLSKSKSKSNYCSLNISIICLCRYILSYRLPLDSIFIICQKDKGCGGSGGNIKRGSLQGSANSVQSVTVNGQWVGGTLGNSTSNTTSTSTSVSTPAALAAVQRKIVDSDNVLNEWETLSLILCLKNLTSSVVDDEKESNYNSEKKGNWTKKIDIDNDVDHDNNNNNSTNNNSNSDSNENNDIDIIVMENAAIAIHALLLNRGREAGGKVIAAALAAPSSASSVKFNENNIHNESEKKVGKELDSNNIKSIKSTDDNSNSKIDNNNNNYIKKIEEEKEEEVALGKFDDNNNNNEKLIEKLMKIISTPSYTRLSNNNKDKVLHTPHNTHNNTHDTHSTNESHIVSKSNLVRLMAAKVLDVWYSTGAGISPELLNAEDEPTDADSGK